jgi:hypothetical protein
LGADGFVGMAAVATEAQARAASVPSRARFRALNFGADGFVGMAAVATEAQARAASVPSRARFGALNLGADGFVGTAAVLTAEKGRDTAAASSCLLDGSSASAGARQQHSSSALSWVLRMLLLS